MKFCVFKYEYKLLGIYNYLFRSVKNTLNMVNLLTIFMI